MAWGGARGWSPRQNTWVIDSLIRDDVVVVDLFGKIRNGTFAGDNLSTAIQTRTGTRHGRRRRDSRRPPDRRA